jgi:hypothetical protein
MRPDEPTATAQTDARPSAGWYPDPHGHHEHRYWDGTTWTENVADGGVTATDPVVAGADTAASRAAIQAAISESDGGHLPKDWPERYELAVADVLGALESAEQVRAAWRIRNTARDRRSDFGILVVTDKRVLAADHSSKGSGLLAVPAGEVAGVTVTQTFPKLPMHEIDLLGQGQTVLGDNNAPARFRIFAAGSSLYRDAAELGKVSERFVALLPAAQGVLDAAGASRSVATIAAVLLAPRQRQIAAATTVDHMRTKAIRQLQKRPDGIPEGVAVAALLVNAGHPTVSRPLVAALTASGSRQAASTLAALLPATADAAGSHLGFGWRLDPGLATAVAQGLAAIGDRATIEPLALADLGDLGDVVLEGLAGELDNEDTSVGGNAALALGRLGDHRALPALGTVAQRAKPDFEWTGLKAVDALTEIGGDEAASWLVNAVMRARLESVQAYAATALGRFDPDLAAPRLAEAAGYAVPGSRAHLEIGYALSNLDRPEAAAALESLVAAGAVLDVARTLAIVTDPPLWSAFEQRLRPGERPAFVVHNVPARLTQPGPGTSLVALDDRLLVHTTGATSAMVVDGVQRQVPEIVEVPYARLTEVAVQRPHGPTAATSGEKLTASLVGGGFFAAIVAGNIEAAHKVENQPWVTVRGDGVAIDLGGATFVARAQAFVSWLQERVRPS